jgi:hypothetical protein
MSRNSRLDEDVVLLLTRLASPEPDGGRISTG